MKMTSEAKEKALREVTGFLSAGHAYTRLEVIDGVLSRYDFSEKEKRQKVVHEKGKSGRCRKRAVPNGGLFVACQEAYDEKRIVFCP